MIEKKGYKDLEIAGNLPAATSLEYKTGSWRVMKPVFNPDLCTHCMICVVYCPDMSIPIKNSEEGIKGKNDRIYKGTIRLETIFDYCKGCGICEVECPSKAIQMIREEEENNTSSI